MFLSSGIAVYFPCAPTADSGGGGGAGRHAAPGLLAAAVPPEHAAPRRGRRALQRQSWRRSQQEAQMVAVYGAVQVCLCILSLCVHVALT